MASLKIFMPSAMSSTVIDCWATRFDESDKKNVIIETFLDSSQRNTLFSNITPGLVRELYSVLGVTKFVDGTFRKKNTLFLEPQSGYGLSGIRSGKSVAVKSASDVIIPGGSGYFNVKLECIQL